MSTDTMYQQSASFADSWQTWLILRHFLPAHLQRSLVHEVVHAASSGTIKFADLFEEVLIDGPIWNESWMIRPKDNVNGYAAGLQSWARSIAWQNDEDALGSREDESDPSLISLVFLNIVTDLATADFSRTDDELEGYLGRYSALVQPTLRCCLDAIKAARDNHSVKDPSTFWDDITALVTSTEMPLRAIMLKHIADLCGDADAWRQALEGYERVQVLLKGWTPSPPFEDAAKAWRTITLQSRACALRTLQLPTSDDTLLERTTYSTTLASDPFFAANAGLDTLVIRSLDDSRGYRDPRISLQWAPLLHAAHRAHYALGYWLDAEHQKASRRFWALLRRQIALGAATEIRATKEWYARCIIDQLTETIEKHDQTRSFFQAARLLIESGHAKQVARIEWSSVLVDACLTRVEDIDELVKHAHAYEGSKIERIQVIVELFKSWAIKITPSRPPLIEQMWKHIAYIARDYEATFDGRTDVGRPALEALQELGKKRPELIPAVGADVTEAICKKLREPFMWGQTEAAEAAMPYVESFDKESLRKVTSAILEALEAQPPEKGDWLHTGAPFLFLVNPRTRQRMRGEDELNRRALEQIFRYGLSDRSQAMMIFFHLADFDDNLLDEESTRARLQGPLEQVRKRASQINSSDVRDNIRALLVAPRIAGYDGIRDAFDGLYKLIESAKSESRRSIGFTGIDGALLLLVEYKQRIEEALPEHGPWFQQQLEELAERLAEIWEYAATNPMVFAPFAIPPPTKPNRIVIHNCAFASLRLAHIAKREVRMQQALDKASENNQLGPEITLARATHSSGAKFALSDPGKIGNEDRTTFYRALGRRLTYLQRVGAENDKSFAQDLIAKCMHLGPDPADAAVFVIAANLGLHDHVRASGLQSYAGRVRQNSEMRLLLLPILDLFLTAEMGDPD